MRIVTDHGWLLMPGGLPQAQLVAGLTVEGGKGHRVATLKEGAPTTYPRLPWSWDNGVLLATATGDIGHLDEQIVCLRRQIGAEHVAPLVKPPDLAP